MPHLPETFGPAEKGKVRQTAYQSQSETDQQSGWKIQNQREKPGAGSHAGKKMTDDEK